MKKMKLTAAVLALIAAAVFNPAAKAAGSTGDLILGVYDTTNNVSSSFELDLGSFGSLTPGEIFSIGTSISSFFSSDSSASLVFDIAGAGEVTGGGSLNAKEIALTAATLPKLTSTTNNNPNTNIANMYSEFGAGDNTAVSLPSGTSSTGTSISAFGAPNADLGSFDNAVNANAGNFGYGGGNSPSLILSAFATGTPVTFYTVANVANGHEAAVASGTFEFEGTGANTELVFDPAAAPEPSTYALMACGLLALGAFKFRRSNA